MRYCCCYMQKYASHARLVFHPLFYTGIAAHSTYDVEVLHTWCLLANGPRETNKTWPTFA